MNKAISSKTRVYLSIELLKSLTKKELEGLLYFAENPYFNTDKDLAALLKPLKKYAFAKEKFTTDVQLKVYQAVFGQVDKKQKELNKKQKDFLTNKLNALLRLAEQFLMIDYMNNKPDLKFDLLYPQLIDKKQNLLFNRHLKRDQKKLDEEEKKGVEYHENQYKFNKVLLDYYFKEDLLRKTDNYEKLQYHLDIKYLLNKLKCHLAQVTMSAYVANKQYDFSSFNALTSLITLPKYKSNPLIQLYLLNINLMKKQDDETYSLLLKKLSDENDRIPPIFLQIFYANITNFCVFNIKNGKLDYQQKLFELYQQMHESDVLSNEKNDIDLRLLKNVISASCIVNEFEWAKQVLHFYEVFLPLDIRESTVNYNLGKIAFEEGLFSEAHAYFTEVGKIDHIYDINVKISILKCIYEQEVDYQEATLQSFFSAKVFFKRNTFLTVLHKTGYINFIVILTELYKIKHQESKSSLDKLLNKFEKMEQVINPEWLLKKMKELS